MARDISDLERGQWDTIENTEERRVLDLRVGRGMWLTRTDLQAFGKTEWSHQPFTEVLTTIGGWAMLLVGEPDEPERIPLAPGKVVGVDPDEWWRIEAGTLGAIVISVWEGTRGARRYDRSR